MSENESFKKKPEASRIYWYISGMTKNVCRKIYTQFSQPLSYRKKNPLRII